MLLGYGFGRDDRLAFYQLKGSRSQILHLELFGNKADKKETRRAFI